MQVTEEMIERVVRGFYAKVRRDPELAPIFDAAIDGDWEPHLSKMMDFWSSVILKSARYNGRPLPVHIAQTSIKPEHFERWLALFRENAVEVCPKSIAAAFVEKAELIAESFKLGMYGLPNPNRFPARPAPQ